jgi:hypothetical protein
MTSDTDKLRAWRDSVSAGENCLALEALEQLASGASSDPKFNHHVARCPHCQTELAMLMSFESLPSSAKDEKSVEWIVGRLRSAQTLRSSCFGFPALRALLTAPNLAGAAALTLAIGLGLSLYVSDRQARPVLRVTPSETKNMRSGDVRLVGPTGDLDVAPVEFRWYAVPLARCYSVQLFEVDGTLLWSGQSTDNALNVSPELKSMMRPGKQLRWKVTALDALGRPISESSQLGFRIRLAR